MFLLISSSCSFAKSCGPVQTTIRTASLAANKPAIPIEGRRTRTDSLLSMMQKLSGSAVESQGLPEVVHTQRLHDNQIQHTRPLQANARCHCSAPGRSNSIRVPASARLCTVVPVVTCAAAQPHHAPLLAPSVSMQCGHARLACSACSPGPAARTSRAADRQGTSHGCSKWVPKAAGHSILCCGCMSYLQALSTYFSSVLPEVPPVCPYAL